MTAAKRFGSTKTYTHSQGLSCAFRQWRAASHCQYIHGYALQVTLDFQAEEGDENGWVVDFGGLKEVKTWLEYNFDHKLLVAASDPRSNLLLDLQPGVAQIVMMPEVGCENFADYIADYVQEWLAKKGLGTRVWLQRVTVSEHDGNSAYVEFMETNV
jgi:6-pyruvoyltetrahydropterin/6-carboxytetrahydropterin synthase